MAVKNEGKKDPESKRTGGTCGEFVGCLVILIAVLGIIFWFVVKPKLEEAGYSLDKLLGRAAEMKEEVVGAVRDATDKLDTVKDKLNTASDQVQNFKDDLKDKANDLKDKTEDVKDDTQDIIPDIPEKSNNVKNKIQKQTGEPELIEG